MLEPGETQAIVNAVVGQVQGALDQLAARIAVLESRAMTRAEGGDGSGVDAGTLTRLDQIEGAIVEVQEWTGGAAAAIEARDTALAGMQAAIVNILAGGVDVPAWRGFVLRECVRLGIGPRDVAVAMREARGGDEPGVASGEGS